MGDTWTVVGATLLGAAVGGFATYLGAVSVMRKERVTVRREQIRAELLPDVEAGLVPNRYAAMSGLIDSLQRVARVASLADEKRADTIAQLCMEAKGAYDRADQEPGEKRGLALDGEYRERRDAALEAIDAYDEWLGRETRHRRWRLLHMSRK